MDQPRFQSSTTAPHYKEGGATVTHSRSSVKRQILEKLAIEFSNAVLFCTGIHSFCFTCLNRALTTGPAGGSFVSFPTYRHHMAARNLSPLWGGESPRQRYCRISCTNVHANTSMKQAKVHQKCTSKVASSFSHSAEFTPGY